MKNIAQGARHFHSQVFQKRRDFFTKLANGQSPSVLFITCSDSRICPNLLLNAQPGDIFTIRNAGNIVPPHGDYVGSESASIDFALNTFAIKDLVICGHSDCGAIHRAVSQNDQAATAHAPIQMDTWLKHAVSGREITAIRAQASDQSAVVSHAIEANVLKQVAHLQTHTAVKNACAQKKLRIHAWHYHIGQGLVYSYDFSKKIFEPLR